MNAFTASAAVPNVKKERDDAVPGLFPIKSALPYIDIDCQKLMRQ